ncbi:hypothetical protein [Actibacterium sp. MT2.3-13A]|uniref:hypothetical protein n=1 Tax=Actibacterium sp. MT2.3-13A TaxID=2828332 RepID=UPI001BA89529|nr:hypothetical protein [Actibacterium sp. MT2.3-13A]
MTRDIRRSIFGGLGRAWRAGALIALATAGTAQAQEGAQARHPAAPPEQWAQYVADVPKTIIELQPFRTSQSAALDSGGAVELINLNPNINAWFLLRVGGQDYHLENPDPEGRTVTLGAGPALAVSGKQCIPWAGDNPELARARATGLPFAPICGGGLFLLNKASGTRSTLEGVTDFLRDHVWAGEQIVRIVRDTLYKDSFIETGKVTNGAPGATAPDGPAPARIAAAHASSRIAPSGLGLALGNTDKGNLSQGAWYPVVGLPGVFASAIQPRAISEEVLKGPGTANWLDGVESGAVDFFVAFDLSRYGMGFALGTDHPRLDWSPRPPWNVRVKGLPGPDGIASSAPLMRSGMVSPAEVGRTVAAFAAGFKRSHGAFKYGDLREAYKGRHYGFIEDGVIFSKLWPDLSTLYMLDDGQIGMKTWTVKDNALLPRLRWARQNGVALIEGGIPGPRVTQWGPGNWSGSANADLRTLRAGACLQSKSGRRYLVYAYFSAATPSAMARTFQAYGCDYAMLLDMNAPELTYLALYVPRGGEMRVEHLITAMSANDKTTGRGDLIPRFIGFPDSRDLFYIYRKAD